MKQFSSLLLITLLASCFGTDPQKTGKEGKPLPSFNLLLVDSTTRLNTTSIPTGQPIALFYFSPYCPYCRAQTEEIIEDMDKLKDIRFYFISSFPLPALKSFYKEFKLAKYPNIIAGVDTTAHAIRDYFEISGVPFMAIYNKHKILNKGFMGKIYSSQIIKAAEE